MREIVVRTKLQEGLCNTADVEHKNWAPPFIIEEAGRGPVSEGVIHKLQEQAPGDWLRGVGAIDDAAA